MTTIFKDDNGNELPQNIQDRVNAFIEHLPQVSWFKPNKDIKKSDIETQVKFTLECFWVKADIEYRKLKTKNDWDSARDSVWASVWDSARASVWDSARASVWDSDWDSARSSVWDGARSSAWASVWDSDWESARDSSRDSASASQEILLEDNEEFKKKYPNGAFKQLFKLWEMWLYPVGVLDDTKTFVVYVPPISSDFPDVFNN